MNSDNEVEVTLAQDSPVGPRGGMVKADTQVRLPWSEAELLVAQGAARYEKKSAAVVPAATVSEAAAAAPAAEGGNK